MKISEKAKAVRWYIRILSRHYRPEFGQPGGSFLDLILFHTLHFHMPGRDAYRCFRRLKSSFVDWNEVRISSIREIASHLDQADDPLGLALFIRDLLARVHSEKQTVSLEFLNELTAGEVRRFLRQLKGIDSSTVSLVLRVKKDSSAVPMEPNGERILRRLGLLPANNKGGGTVTYLARFIEDHQVIPLHHLLLQHGRSVCTEEDFEEKCSRCVLRTTCGYYRRTQRNRRNHRGGSNHRDAKRR